MLKFLFKMLLLSPEANGSSGNNLGTDDVGNRSNLPQDGKFKNGKFSRRKKFHRSGSGAAHAGASLKVLNSPAYYGMNTPLGKQAANIQTAYVYGEDWRKNAFAFDSDTLTSCSGFPTGTIMAITLDMDIPNRQYGTTSDEAHNITVSTYDSDLHVLDKTFINLFNQLRGAKTSTVPFDPVDIGMYLLAVGSIDAAIGYIQSIFNHYAEALPNNMLSPQAITAARACSGIYTDLVHNYANSALSFSKLIDSMAEFPVPQGLPFFQRARHMFNNYYCDEERVTGSNLYIFKLGRCFKYNATKSTNGGGLDVVDFSMNPNDSTTMDDLITKLADMMNALMVSEDMRNIGAWIISNMTPENLAVLDPKLPDDPVNNAEILNMIMNSACSLRHDNQGIYQCNGVMVSDDHTIPSSDTSKRLHYYRMLSGDHQLPLTAYKDLSPDEIMVSTRMRCNTRYGSIGGVSAFYYDGDLFTPVKFTFVYGLPGNATQYSDFEGSTAPTNLEEVNWTMDGHVYSIKLLASTVFSSFDYMPAIWAYDAPGNYYLQYMHQGHLIHLPKKSLDTLNYVSIQAQFGLLKGATLS